MTDGVDLDTLPAAVVSALSGVTGISVIQDRPGGVPAWVVKARPKQSFWTVDFLSAGERGAGVGTYGIETIEVQLEGWMPWSYENPNTAPVWRGLLRDIKDRLRSRPTLAGNVKNTQLPNLATNDLREFPDGLTCHHAVIRLTCDRYFDYTATGA